MSLSLELIRQRNENVVRSLTRAAGRHPQWWFAKLMRLGVSQSPSALTGNRLAAIYSVTLDEPNPVRVTVQPQEHVHFLLDLLGECPAFSDEARDSITALHRRLQAAGVDSNLGIGATLAPDQDEARVYVGCPENQKYDALANVLAESDLWDSRLSGLPRQIVSIAGSTGHLIGLARRFAKSMDCAFYFSIDVEPCLDAIDPVVEAVGESVGYPLREFFSRIRVELGPKAKWGWAVAIKENGDLAYIKLEASGGEIQAARILRTTNELPSYRALDAITVRNDLQLEPQTISCASGPNHFQTSCYFRMQPRDEASPSPYLAQPRFPGKARATQQDVEGAVSRAVSALTSAQTPAGCWSDFNIEGVGPSDEWVTAHVGFKLAGLPALYSPTVHKSLQSAADYLHDRWRNGLSYNAFSPIDADSTIHALLFWQALGRRPSEEETGAALQFQLDEGCFSTFLQNGDSTQRGSWAIGHPEVTAVAIQALWLAREQPSIQRRINEALNWVDSLMEHDELGHSFWWNLHWYARLQWAKVMKLAEREIPAALMPGKAPFAVTSKLDAAYLSELCLILDRLDDASLIASSLVETQQANGFWQTSPILRVVHPDCREPWNESHKVLTYADSGCYSGAAILSALMNIRHKM